MTPKEWRKMMRGMGGEELEPLPDGSCPICRMLGVEEPPDDGLFRIIIDTIEPGRA